MKMVLWRYVLSKQSILTLHQAEKTLFKSVFYLIRNKNNYKNIYTKKQQLFKII